MFSIIVSILLHSSTLFAANSVVIPERVDDLAEHCLQLAKALSVSPQDPIRIHTPVNLTSIII